MSFRDDHDAALMRADAAERERDVLAKDAARLEAELASAREWLGGPSKRGFLIGALVVLGIGLVLIGVVIGRATVESAPAVPVVYAKPATPLPEVTGVLVADGPRVGHFTMTATRCAARSDGVELTTIGDAGVSIWLGNDQVELETTTKTGTLYLNRKLCISKLVAAVRRIDDMYEGHLELDCQFEGNWLQGRIDFKYCR